MKTVRKVVSHKVKKKINHSQYTSNNMGKKSRGYEETIHNSSKNIKTQKLI